MPLQIVRNDITKMSVDAIVNIANTSLKNDGGVCGAIFSVAGAKTLQAERDLIDCCEIGESVITSSYDYYQNGLYIQLVQFGMVAMIVKMNFCMIAI